MAVLPLVPDLAHDLPFSGPRADDRLAVAHAWLADVRVDAMLPHHPLLDHLEMELSHPGNDQLAGLVIRSDPEGRIVLRHLGEHFDEPVLVRARLRLDGHR